MRSLTKALPLQGIGYCRLKTILKDDTISYTDDVIILLNYIFTGLHGYQITPGLSTNKQRHRFLLLKTGIHVAPTNL